MKTILTIVMGTLFWGVPLGGWASDHLLISEFCVIPMEAEFIEIHNPTADTISLEHYYLTDATYADEGKYYYQVVLQNGTGGAAGPDHFYDFNAYFPFGSEIPPGEYQVIAVQDTLFFATYGRHADYELLSTDPTVPNMRAVEEGSIDNNVTLSNEGEVLILYWWDRESDLVQDVDYVLWGDKDEAVDKSGVCIDGPDPDGGTTCYLNDTPIANQVVVNADGDGDDHPHNFWMSAQRSILNECGEAGYGNGITGHDETSEDLSYDAGCWSCHMPPSPGGPCALQDYRASSIFEVQYTTDPSGNSPLLGTLVLAYGIVSEEDFVDDGFVIAERLGGPWRGVRVYTHTNTVSRGDSVAVYGVVGEYCGRTEIVPDSVLILASDRSVPPPLPVLVADVETGSTTSESLEGVLVELGPVVVAQDYVVSGEWTAMSLDGLDTCRVDNPGYPAKYSYDPEKGDTLDFLRGVLNYSLGTFKVSPRDDGDIGTPGPLRRWTVMVYGDGDNSLENEIEADRAEMEAVGSSDSVTILLIVDGRGEGDTHLYRVEEGASVELGDSAPWLDPEENMGDPQTLVDFVTWSVESYPARHSMVVLRNHGHGIWAECDDETNDGDYLSLPELDSALAAIKDVRGGQKLDIVAHDACLMGMVELHYQMAPYVDIGIASESEEPDDGWHYTEPLSALRADPWMTPRELASVIVETFVGFYGPLVDTNRCAELGNVNRRVAQAAFDLAALETEFIPLVDSFAVQCSVSMDYPSIRSRIVRARRDADLYFDYQEPWSKCSVNKDVISFCELMVEDSVIKQEAFLLWRAADTLTKVCRSSVLIAEGFGPCQPNAEGMTIWFPQNYESNECTPTYEDENVRFSHSRWPRFLAKYDEKVKLSVFIVRPYSVHEGVAQANLKGILDELEVTYELHELTRHGMPPGDLLISNTVIIWLGYGPLTAKEEVFLRSYLDGGGRLLYISEDSPSDLTRPSPFLVEYLGVVDLVDAVMPAQIQGVSGDPIGDGLYFDVTAEGLPGFIPGPRSSPVFRYIAESGEYKPFSYGALKCEKGPSRAVFLSFPLEVIEDVGVRAEVMERILSWLNP